MPDPDWKLIGEQLASMLREQTVLREENREIRATLGAVARKLDTLDRKLDALADDIALLKIEVRALADRLEGLK